MTSRADSKWLFKGFCELKSLIRYNVLPVGKKGLQILFPKARIVKNIHC